MSFDATDLLRNLFTIGLGLGAGASGLSAFKTIKKDGRVARFALEGHLGRVLIAGGGLTMLLGLIFSICVYGVALHILAATHVVTLAPTGLQNPSAGSYDTWSLTVLLAGASTLFGGILFAVLIEGHRGLKARSKSKL